MINEIKKYNEIRKIEGLKSADDFASKYIASLNLYTPGERGAVWSKFKEELKKEQSIKEGMENLDKIKEKKEKSKNRASIKKICEKILSKSNLTKYEEKFINDIKTKRKLTDKQESFLRGVAEKNNIEIQGSIETRQSRLVKSSLCDHDDLGSRGYTHGSIVACQNCGEAVEVW